MKWQRHESVSIEGEAQAREVNVHGAILHMTVYPPVGTEVELANPFSAERARARVVAIRCSREGAVQGVAIELLVPSETFWGVPFRLKRVSAELLKLSEAIKSGGIDLRVLRDFRDAVDYVRKTAWVVYEWQERQLGRRDVRSVLSLLTVERIRRATQLNNDLANDLHAHEVTPETVGISDLFQAIDRIHQRLTDLLKCREAR